MKMQGNSPRLVAWNASATVCILRKFPTFSISNCRETLPKKSVCRLSLWRDGANLTTFHDIRKRSGYFPAIFPMGDVAVSFVGRFLLYDRLPRKVNRLCLINCDEICPVVWVGISGLYHVVAHGGQGFVGCEAA